MKGCVRALWVQFDQYNYEWICPVSIAVIIVVDMVRGGESLDKLNAGFCTKLTVVY